MPRIVFLCGLGLALVGCALAATDWALSLEPGVTEANAKRIRPGMTLTDVEALMGGGAHWEDEVTATVNGHMEMLRPHPFSVVLPEDPDEVKGWEGADGAVLIYFAPDNRVTEVNWHARRRPLSLLDRLRAWLGW